MRNLKNERGMALVMVLLILTVFSICGLAVMGASINNMKQATKSESDIVKTDIAEMGVVYYETQLKAFLNNHLNNNNEQQSLINSFFTGSSTNISLIQSFNTQFPVQLNTLYKADPSLFTNSADQFLQEKPVSENSSFKIKINPSGIIPITCPSDKLSNTQCFNINFDSYGYYGQNLERKISATFSFSYTINSSSIVISSTSPTSVQKYQSLINSIQDKNLRKCSTNDFNKNITKVDCSSDLDPSQIPDTNGITHSFIVFNKGAEFDHLSHAVSDHSSLFIYSPANTATKIGMFNPNGFENSTIVIIGDAWLSNTINKPVNSSIYITGNANLTGFELKNVYSDDSITKICVNGAITPASMKNTARVYSNIDTPALYKTNCMETSTTVGNNSLTFNGDVLTSVINDKSKVTY